MIKTALITDQEYNKLANDEIGHLALYYRQLLKQQIPVLASYCLPISVLQQIAQFNRLENKVRQLIGKINLKDKQLLDRIKNKIKQLIAYQEYPVKISKQLQQFHQQNIKQNFINIRASYINGEYDKEINQDNVLGDANMLDSILQIWAESIRPEDIVQANIFPAAIFIQIHQSEKISGVAYSIDPHSQQKHIIIEAVYGIFSENQSQATTYFAVNPSTWKIEQKKIKPQSTQLVRINDGLEEKKLAKKTAGSFALSNSEAIKLAKIIQQIKQSQLNQVKVIWSKSNQQFLVNQVSDFFPTEKQDLKQLIIVGESLVGGVIEAEAKVVINKNDLNEFKLGQIAVVNQLNKNNISLIKKSSAIVCQNYIDDHHVFQELKINSRPCVVKANYACDKINDGNQLLVDASGGKIYLQKYNSQTEIKQKLSKLKHTLTKIFPRIDNYSNNNISNYFDQTLILNTDPLFFENQLHPLAIIRNNKQQLLEKQFVKSILDLLQNSQQINKFSTLIYRLNNLTSAELLQLNKSFSFEVKEINPDLGFRGSLRNISNFDLINFELDVIKRLGSKITAEIQIMLPFVRTPIELKIIKQHINNYLQKNISIWMELDTPENIEYLGQYLKQDIDGIVFNLKQVYYLYKGIDPTNNDITKLYPIDEAVIKLFLTKIQAQVEEFKEKQQKENIPKIIINIPEYSQELINVCHQSHPYAIVIKRRHIEQIEKYLKKLEGK